MNKKIIVIFLAVLALRTGHINAMAKPTEHIHQKKAINTADNYITDRTTNTQRQISKANIEVTFFSQYVGNPFIADTVINAAYKLKNWAQENWITSNLNGIEYKIAGLLGEGYDGAVFKIVSPENKQYALKIYCRSGDQNGDLLALQKAEKSKRFMNLPIVVNTHYHYSIFPLLRKTLYECMREAEDALRADGLVIYDGHEANWMVNSIGQLVRIDLTTLQTLPKQI